jgi:hypothetical protein
MHQMAVDINQRGAIGFLMDDVVIPKFVVKGAQSGHGKVLARAAKERDGLFHVATRFGDAGNLLVSSY